jgi:hypothetical protein
LCRRCGGGEEPYKGGVCVRCTAHERLHTAFADAQGRLTPHAQALVDALTASRRPRSVLQWLGNPHGGAMVLRELLEQGKAIDHATLDKFDGRQVWALRQSLIQLGLLQARNEPLARLTPWLDELATGLPTERRRLLLTYGTWWVLRRARNQLERTGRFTQASGRAARRRLTAAAAFLAWLDGEDLALNQLDQAALDRWFDTGGTESHEAADFLRWARNRGLTTAQAIRRRPARDLGPTVSEGERWAALTRCLHDASIPNDIRAAGALVLLYGLQLSRIVELTEDHLHHAQSSSYDAGPTDFRVTLNGPLISVPPPLSPLLRALPAPPAGTVPLIGPTGGDPAWLFPGRAAGRHIAPGALSAKLATHGIRARSSRNAVLIALAAELPVAVLSDLFDLSTAAAVGWARHAARDWQGYIAALEHDRPPDTRRIEDGAGPH